MWLLLIMGIAGCPKKDLVKEARSAFTNQNCVRTLDTYMRGAGCHDLYLKKEPVAVVIKCKKEQTNSMWDRYWFRISPSFLKISPDQLPEVERHTICIDDRHRLEAYPAE